MDLPSVADILAGALAAGAAAGVVALRRRLRARPPRRAAAGPAEEPAFATLHAVARVSPPLRGGLNPASARKAARHLRALLGAEAVAFVAVPTGDDDPCDDDPCDDLYAGERAGDGGPLDTEKAAEDAPAPRLLAWDGIGHDEHAGDAVGHALPVLASGRPRVLAPELLGCRDPFCRIQVAMIAPLAVEGRVEATLAAYWTGPSTARVRAVGEAARLVTGQLELARLDTARIRLAEAEMRALRAQISPHFVYNSLTTIASFVRTDPERARGLLLDFADFARYSFRNPRDFTTLADELRSIDRYLLLERARFGDRLRFDVQVAPEVLPVAVPFLALQPLVENAIRHGMKGTRGPLRISIVARDCGAEAAISVEDDGVGMDPERLQEILAAPVGRPGPTGWGSVATPDRRGGGIGLANVDERMRQVYGEEYGLTVETALGAGTKVRLRVPKYRPGVFPD
ncbi:sensor histidine kinase [Actinomadura verrucosospora]|uniref:histidine kinase n=1 Tax=Actinomadura verrucosospora TaxID=46165 RepID=A0A7D4A211_ACTVE|nr:histidine kinase [Actinomadura verrucosospora]QKG26506.1 signal transduction histidine kinase LytS [Actinomadura verrucosospora]